MPNALAQQILLALNWRFGGENAENGTFLDQNLHLDVAYTLSDLYGQYCEKPTPNLLSGSMKKVVFTWRK